jgi:hypothetical protein
MTRILYFITNSGRIVKRTFNSEESKQDFLYKVNVLGSHILIADCESEEECAKVEKHLK